jgi:hypothetical protein
VKEINYKGLFVAGCTFLAAGVTLMISLGPVGVGLIGIGLGMMAVGLTNREKWDGEA